MFIQGFYISKTICSTIISITCTFYTLLSFNHLPVSLGCNEERKTARAVPRQPSSSNITSMTSTELLKLCASIPLNILGDPPDLQSLSAINFIGLEAESRGSFKQNAAPMRTKKIIRPAAPAGDFARHSNKGRQWLQPVGQIFSSLQLVTTWTEPRREFIIIL